MGHLQPNASGLPSSVPSYVPSTAPAIPFHLLAYGFLPGEPRLPDAQRIYLLHDDVVTQPDYDVAVIGAGAAGLYAAAELAERGCSWSYWKRAIA